MKTGFTLAEVLITLGIIGVVAALTLPGLLQEYANLVVGTKLKKFYSQINQAIRLSEAEYGDKKYWYSDTNSVTTDSDGKPVAGSSTAEKWFNKYIGSHMTIIKVSYDENALPTFYFKDGTALKLMAASMQDTTMLKNMRDWTFYTSYPDKCLKLYGNEETSRGKCSFQFIFAPEGEPDIADSQNRNLYKFHLNKGFEPYKYNWNGSYTNLKNKCKNSNPEYCTALIQMNNWKIPKDYPFKVSY